MQRDLCSVKPYAPLLILQNVNCWNPVKHPEIDPNIDGQLFYKSDQK